MSSRRFRAGLFTGLGHGFNNLAEHLQQDQAQQEIGKRQAEEQSRQNVNQVLEKLMAGQITQDQARAALRLHGVNADLTGMAPTEAVRTAPVFEGIGKANDLNDAALTPGGILSAFEAKGGNTTPQLGVTGVNRRSLDGEGPVDETLPSTQLGPVSPPRLQSALSQGAARQTALGNQPAGFDVSSTSPETGQTVKRRPTVAETQGGIATETGLSSADEGRLAGVKAGTQLEAETPYKVTSANTLEAGTRDEKVKTTTATARGQSQAAADVQSNPRNIAGAASRAAAIAAAEAQAKQDVIDKGISPEIANNYVSATSTGRSYAYVPPGTDPAIAHGIQRSLGAVGVRFVDAKQRDALQQIEAARGGYNDIVNRFRTALAKDAGNRPLNTVRNTLGVYLQRDPELASAVATSFPTLIQTLKAQAGPIGRIMQIEIEGMKQAMPKATDTLQTAQLNKIAMLNGFQRIEDAILGKAPSAPGAAGGR